MFARYLSVDDKRAPPASQVPDFGITLDPSLDDIATAINTMDGEYIRVLIVAAASPTVDSHFPWSGREMLIGGGGSNGLYCCMIGMEDETTAYYLCDPNADPTEEIEIMRGHMTDMGRKYCVDRSTLLDATLLFTETGDIGDAFTWETGEE